MVAKATDHAVVLELNDKLRAVVDERETLEMEWLEARRGPRLGAGAAARPSVQCAGRDPGQASGVRRGIVSNGASSRRSSVGERGLLALAQPGEEEALAVEQVGHRRVDDVAARPGSATR